jgi:hypothetical protein
VEIKANKLFIDSDLDPKLLQKAGISVACADVYPLTIMYDRITLRNNPMTNVYDVSTERISVIDGYFDLDDGFFRT